mgnify:CR=1 FL=1
MRGHLRDVEIDTHEHALASQRAVRHVGEGGLRSAAEWGGVGCGGAEAGAARADLEVDAAHPACAQGGGQPRGDAPPARCRKHGHAQHSTTQPGGHDPSVQYMGKNVTVKNWGEV